MYVFIEVEVFKREFLGKILLSKAIIDDKIKIIIANRLNLKNLILSNNINNGILITKDINPRKDLIEYYKFLKSKNFAIISQDEEAGIVPNDYSIFSSLRHGNGETLKVIDYFLCWGNRDFDFHTKKFNDIRDKFINFGSPRIDTAHENFNIDKNLLFENGISKKFILLSYNFQPFYYRSFLERISNESERLKNEFKKFSESFFTRESESLKLLNDFTELADFLEKNQKEYQIVIRPHPNFNIEKFSKILRNINKNIIICNEGNLIEFTKNCEVLIHNSCSASIEAAINKKQIISYKTQNNKFFKSDYLNSLGFNAETKDEVMQLIKSKKIKIIF